MISNTFHMPNKILLKVVYIAAIIADIWKKNVIRIINSNISDVSRTCEEINFIQNPFRRAYTSVIHCEGSGDF